MGGELDQQMSIWTLRNKWMLHILCCAKIVCSNSRDSNDDPSLGLGRRRFFFCSGYFHFFIRLHKRRSFKHILNQSNPHGHTFLCKFSILPLHCLDITISKREQLHPHRTGRLASANLSNHLSTSSEATPVRRHRWSVWVWVWVHVLYKLTPIQKRGCFKLHHHYTGSGYSAVAIMADLLDNSSCNTQEIVRALHVPPVYSFRYCIDGGIHC